MWEEGASVRVGIDGLYTIVDMFRERLGFTFYPIKCSAMHLIHMYFSVVDNYNVL